MLLLGINLGTRLSILVELLLTSLASPTVIMCSTMHDLIRTDGPARHRLSLQWVHYSGLVRITATEPVIENYNLSQKTNMFVAERRVLSILQ